MQAYSMKAWVAACLLNVCVATFAQTKAEAKGGEHLRMVVVLTRHGVRSPTWTQERLDSYSALPWPKWSVAPGDLTPRGHQLIASFARYDREAFAAKGLFAATGCADAARTYLWADTDQRTMETGQALAEGLFPGCPVQVHSLAAGENDPLFHPTAKGVSQAKADAAYAEFAARVKQPIDPKQGARVQELQRVLMGCDVHSDCTPAHKPEMLLDTGESGVSRGKGEKIVDLKGPLATASTLSEDLLLEYADGMPAAQVGWGKVDEAQLRSFLALHSDYFELMHRTPALAKLESSNMLAHIVRTLQQGVDGHAVQGAVGPADSKLVMFAGHDTNLAGVAALLGVHWSLDGREDDTPPGTELVFELWQSASGSYSVRVAVAMQTLRQMREVTKLTLVAPPASQELKPPACGPAACGWATFMKAMDGAVDSSSVY